MRDHVVPAILLMMLWLLWVAAGQLPGARYAMSGGLVGTKAPLLEKR